MRRSFAFIVSISIAAFLLLPVGFLEVADRSELDVHDSPLEPGADIESVVFLPALNTSYSVPEYSLVSRALMLPGGSTYSALADINRDGKSDLIVAVSESKLVSIFYGQAGGIFPSSPSYNLHLWRNPIGVATIDLFADGNLSLVVLEARDSDLEEEHLLVFNYTTDYSYSEFRNLTLYVTASSFAVGNYNGDVYPDIAFSCPDLTPLTTPGKIEIRFGPVFSAPLYLIAGRGPSSIVTGNFNSDGLQDLAVTNSFDKNVFVFLQPFSPLNTPNYTLTTSSSNPLALTSGDMNNDGSDDIAVVTENQSKLLFYFQSMGILQPDPNPFLSRQLVNETASAIFCSDMNGDSLGDILMLSADQNRAFGLFQRSSVTIWPVAYDFIFPTGETPRHALIGDLDSDSLADVAVSSARTDWSGSSIAIYPARGLVTPDFSNANSTIWTNLSWESSSLSVGDLDGDGWRDVAMTYPDGQSIGLVGEHSGAEIYVPLGFNPDQMVVSELNGDGFADILVSQASSRNLTLYFGQSSLAGPLNYVKVACESNITDFALGLLNDDELIDIAAATENGTIDIFFNTGVLADPFPNAYEIIAATGLIPALAIGDYNSDGRHDIAYSLQTLEINITFQQTTSPYFLPQTDTQLFHSIGGMFVELWSGDLNGDSKTDIAATTAARDVMFFFDQDDFINPRTPYASLNFPEVPTFASVADMTDDGCADVVVSFDSADLVFLYRQAAGSIPTEPSMVFVSGASPNYVVAGTLGQDDVQSMIVGDSKSHSLSVWRQTNFPPVADAGGPYSSMEGYDLNLTATAIDSVSQIPYMMYRWDFGDGNSTDWLSIRTVIHNYTSNGLYSLFLEVRDPGGRIANNSTSVTITDSVPLADFEWSPLVPIEGQEIVFTDRTWSYDNVVEINWSINGQLVNSGMNHTITSTLQNGTYSVALEVTDYEGSVGTQAKSLTVLRSSPQVSIIGPSSAIEDDEVNFSVQLDPWHSGLGDTVQSYEWDFSYNGVFVSDVITTGNWVLHSFVSLDEITNYTVAVRATDNDGDWAVGFLNITIFDRIKVSINILSPGPFHEFDTINFTVVCNSSHPATLFEWQFDAIDVGSFVPDEPGSDSTNNSHVYGQAGNFLLLVRATVSNGSSAIGWVLVTVLDVVPAGAFEDYITWERNPLNTSDILFRADPLATKYPDIAQTTWQFGDGTSKLVFGGPLAPVVHFYAPNRTYQITLVVVDDDANSLALTSTLKLSAPTIELISPAGDSVIRPGIPVRFSIGDDSPPLVSVQYTMNGGPFTNFTAEWEISTTTWIDGSYLIDVEALDIDGNIALKENIMVIIDDLPPTLEALWSFTSVHGGDSINISVKVTDPHTDDGSIFLNVRLPGAKSYTQVLMQKAGNGVYFAVIEIPKRSGTLQFHISADDLAQNSATSGLYSVSVKLRFIDLAWPFLLALAVLAALGTTAYFIREVETAVDETFVIYNDGRLISHSTRHLKPEMDDQVLSGMLVAIQDFIRESFKDLTSFTLRRLEFGDKTVLIEKGEHLFLAVILHGRASKKVASKMQEIVDEIEEEYSIWLRNWDGDLDTLRGVGDVAKKLYSKAPLFPRFLRRNT